MTGHHRVAVAMLLVWVGAAGAAPSTVRDLLKKEDAWFKGEEAAAIAANVLSWQCDDGGWPKNLNTAEKPFTGDRKTLRSTFDNAATTHELRFLARMASATGEAKYREAFNKGLDLILGAQYANGGWPQTHPPPKGYGRHITFNDDCMTRLMMLVRDVPSQPEFAFVDAERRKRCAQAFERGVQCILKCQIKVDGKLTGWCAQHDEVDFSPRPGRSFEPASLSGGESVGIVRVLMSIEKPSPEVVAAVEGAVAWFESAKIPGIRTEDRPDKSLPKGFDRVVVKDPAAPPMWARFYNIQSNKPMFVDRDGSVHDDLAGIGAERRSGYRWLSYWPARLLAEEYPAWKKKH